MRDMTQAAITGAHWRSAGRHWRARLRRLRRNAAALGLALLISLWLSEPLLCVFHCQIWLPFALQSYFATQHHHHHLQSAPASSDGALGSAAEPAGAPICLSAGGDQGPLYVPPTPIHDLAPLLLAAIILLLLVAALPAAQADKPPQITPPRHLRPPIDRARLVAHTNAPA